MVDGKKETIYAFVYTALSKIITYALVFVFANYYLAEEYGLGNFALNIRNLIVIACCIGLIDGLVPFIVMKKKINSILKTLFIINGFFVIVGLIATIKYPFILPFVITIPFVLLSSIGLAFWRAKSKYGFTNLTILFGITVTLVSAFFLRNQGAFGLAFSYSLGYFLSCLLIIYPIRKEFFESLKGKFDLKEVKTYFKQGIAVTYISNLFLLITSIDSIILGLTGNFKLVAQFGVASAISGVISMIPLTLSLFLITRTGEISDKKKLIQLFHRVVRVSFFASLLISSFLVLFTPLILKIFFNAYTDIAKYILILNLGMVFFSSYYIIYSYYLGRIESHRAIIPVSLGLVFNVFLSLILVYNYNILGICIANAFGHLITLIFMAKNEQIRKVVIISLLGLIILPGIYFFDIFGVLIILALIPLSLALKIINMDDLNVIKESVCKIIRLN